MTLPIRRGYTNPAPARAHTKQHLAAGRSLRQLARLAGVHNSALSRLVTGKTHRIKTDHATRILDAPLPEPAPPRTTDIGCLRRLDALSCMGWSVPAVAQQLGIEPRRLEQAKRRRRFSDPTARLLGDAYPTLANTRGPSWWVVGWALRAGKLPPWAWSDRRDIDNPKATPDLRHIRQGPEPPTLARALSTRPPFSAAYYRAMTGHEPLRDVA